jgi:hypothetical protein
MLATLMNSTENLEMVEYLMAGMWILLRTPENRRVLGTAFSENPAAGAWAALLYACHTVCQTYDLASAAN